MLDGNAFSQSITCAWCIRARYDIVHRRIEFGLDTDYPQVGTQSLGRRCHSGNEPAAAYGHHQGVDVGCVLKHFERHRSLPCNDIGLIERMHKGQAALAFQGTGMGIGGFEGFTVQHHGCAMGFGLHHFHGRGQFWHDDRDRNAKPFAMVGKALGMVSGGGCDDAILARIVSHQEQAVERPALLVGRRELQVFELQVNVRPRHRGQRLALQRGRADDRATDASMGGADIVERDGQVIQV